MLEMVPGQENPSLKVEFSGQMDIETKTNMLLCLTMKGEETPLTEGTILQPDHLQDLLGRKMPSNMNVNVNWRRDLSTSAYIASPMTMKVRNVLNSPHTSAKKSCTDTSSALTANVKDILGIGVQCQRSALSHVQIQVSIVPLSVHRAHDYQKLVYLGIITIMSVHTQIGQLKMVTQT